MVVYQALYGDHGFWVRPKKMFFEKIVRDGKEMCRFTQLTDEEVDKLLRKKE